MTGFAERARRKRGALKRWTRGNSKSIS